MAGMMAGGYTQKLGIIINQSKYFTVLYDLIIIALAITFIAPPFRRNILHSQYLVHGMVFNTHHTVCGMRYAVIPKIVRVPTTWTKT